MIRRTSRLSAALIAALLALAGCDSAEERVAEHHARGLALLEEGAPEKARLEFRNALEIDEDFVPARVEFARILLAEGNVRGAYNHFSKVVEIDPAHAEARLQLANILLLAGEFGNALTHADAAHRADPANPDALLVRALAHYRLGNVEQALADANQVLVLRPGNPGAELLIVTERVDAGDLAAARELVDRFIADNPSDLPLSLMKVQILSKLGDDAGLGAHLEQLVGLHPDNVNLRQLAASWYLDNGRMQDVERELRKIQELQPDDIVTVQNLVRFLIQTRGEKAARDELVAQIEAAGARGAPQFPLQSLLADFDLRLGRVEDARALLDGIVADPPDAATAHEARLRLARIAIAEAKLDRGKELVDAVLAADAKNAEALGMRAAILADQGDTEAAVLDLRAALNESPENVGLLRLAAEVYQRNGNPELAAESLAAAVRLSNAAPDVVLAYVGFLATSGQEGSIETVLTDAVQRRPDSPQLLAALGALHAQNRKWAAAERIAEQLRPLDAASADRIEAAILVGRGRAEEAVALLTRMGETIGAGSVAAAIVQVYVQSDQRDAARGFVDDLLEREPENAEARRLRGALFQLDGEAGKALEAYRAAIAADPGNPAGYLALATLHRSTGRPEEAEAAIAEGLAAVPDNPLLLLYRADQLQEKGDFDGALAAFEALYAMNPNSPIAINNLASTLSEHFSDDPERLAQAEEIVRRLAGVRSPAVQDTYGWILFLRNKPAEALRSLIPAAEGLPDNPWVRYHIGMTYAALDQAEEARSHLDAALALAEGQVFPPSAKIRAELERLSKAE